MERTLLCILIPAALLVFILLMSEINRRRREAEQAAAEVAITQTEQLFAQGEYEQVVDALKTNPLLVYRYKMTYPQRMRVTNMEVDSLEKLGRIPEAVVTLANHLSAVYPAYQWPEDLLNRWLTLYKSCEPPPLEKFYFCPYCGVHPDMMQLLKYATEHGCKPPEGSLMQPVPAVIIHFEEKHTGVSENR